jgi:hypothetical protein
MFITTTLLPGVVLRHRDNFMNVELERCGRDRGLFQCTLPAYREQQELQNERYG